MQKKGMLEVVCGSMFCGKTEELIRRVRRAEYAKKKVLVFKHCFDTRKMVDHVVSHNGTNVKALPIENHEDMLKFVTDDIDVIGIDEIQFFPKSVISTIVAMLDQNKRIIAAGLDLDFRRIPFGPMPTLMAIADTVTKLKAICICCGKDAQFTQRLVNGKPANFDDPIILIGAEECYQARCRECYTIDKSLCETYE
jgi:thymidine kinase